MTTLNIQPHTTIAAMWKRFRRSRTYIIVLVATIAILASGVAIGQASQNYDLACRSVMTGGGGTVTSANYGVIAALGMPMVPPADATPPTYSVRSANYGLRAGFLPGYPTGVAATADSPSFIDQLTNITRLPLLFKEGSIVRSGC